MSTIRRYTNPHILYFMPGQVNFEIGDCIQVALLVPDIHLARYVTSHPDLLSLAISLCIGTMSMSQGVLGVKAGVWQVNCVITCKTCTISQYFTSC